MAINGLKGVAYLWPKHGIPGSRCGDITIECSQLTTIGHSKVFAPACIANADTYNRIDVDPGFMSSIIRIRCNIIEGKFVTGKFEVGVPGLKIVGNISPVGLGLMRQVDYEVFDPLDFLAEVTQHIPNRGEHQVRFYGWYSNKSRGMRAKGVLPVAVSGLAEPVTEFSLKRRMTWAMLIKAVYEVDPLKCPACGGTMKIISLIDQDEVIARILTRSTGRAKSTAQRSEQPLEGAELDARHAPLRPMEGAGLEGATGNAVCLHGHR